ncbi:MAG: alpha-hydroxy acid oxidase [Nannocystaceae bacterium]
MEAVNVWDFEAAAKERIAAPAWGYYASGADDQITLRENRAAFARMQLHYRVLVDVRSRDMRTTALGQPLAMPLLIAPTAFQRLAHPDGELATARAAGSRGTAMILSTLSTTPVEAVTAAATGPVWFQLYVYRDRGATEALVRRVEAAGCSALVLTVDAPLLGKREADVRGRFTLPAGMVAENVTAAGAGSLPADARGSGLAAYFAALLDPGLTWETVAWLRERTALPIVVKGIVRPDDAAEAAARGVAGIVVSNHGGRQLDTAPATIDVLGPLADAVAGRCELYLDGGVRRGTDVVKALALGARAALIGRPALWGLGAAGEAGVAGVLDLLRGELDLAMALCGCPDVAAITRDLVDPRAARPSPRP